MRCLRMLVSLVVAIGAFVPAGLAQVSATPQRYVLVVMADAVPGREAEFNDWYSNVHIPDLLTIPGLRAAQRFVVATDCLSGGSPKYLAIYEVETEDLARFKAALGAKAKTITLSPALDRASITMRYFRELGPRATADHPQPAVK
jgi:hypothetical protein